ncbi:MAG: sugar nucleotide-binding protein [Polyangiaceae bacterium]|nr:sugar nucleotide-binding protein [Polyangiaceae bacterium]
MAHTNPTPSWIPKPALARVVVLGASGFIGRALTQELRERGHAVAAIGGRTADSAQALDAQVDITNLNAVVRVLQQVAGDTVINAAAMANIDRAETDRKACWAINVDGAKNLAVACHRVGMRLLHLSSDAVFGDDSDSHAEDDPPGPVNYYGVSKLASEQAVLALSPHASVLRLSLVLGGGGGNSLIGWLERAHRVGESVHAPDDEFRTPIDISTLASCVSELTTKRFAGVLHLGATAALSRFQIYQRILLELGLDHVQLIRNAPPNPARAPRNRKGCLNVNRAMALLNTRLESPEICIRKACQRSAQTKGTAGTAIPVTTNAP